MKNMYLSKEQKINFLTNMSHELRTPMLGILGSLDLLEKNEQYFKNQPHLENIRECSERLLEIINQIIDLSKIEKGELDKINSLTDIRKVIEESFAAIQPQINSKGIAGELYFAEDLPDNIIIDKNILQRILTELLNNAVKFTEKGKISVATEITLVDQNAYFKITVTDTGVGIDPQNIDNIFHCYYQTDPSSCRQFGGMGLGLYVCKEFLSLLGGTISVVSTPNLGSSFSITAPLELPRENENNFRNQENKDTSNFESNLFHTISILLMEDYKVNQKLIAQTLTQYGFYVETASNGLEGLDLLHKMTFDIILMDMQMPLMDGYEATELIRSNQQWDKIPIIAVTANNSAQDCKRCLETGCSAYIAKPFKFEQLIEEIKHQLHNGGYTRHKKVKSLSNIDFIQDLLPDFFSSMTEMMEKLKYAIEKNDTETILFASHAIKGTAGMYGFRDVSKLAHQIEKFAPQQDYYELNVLYKHLEILLTQAHKIISKNQAIIS